MGVNLKHWTLILSRSNDYTGINDKWRLCISQTERNTQIEVILLSGCLWTDRLLNSIIQSICVILNTAVSKPTEKKKMLTHTHWQSERLATHFYFGHEATWLTLPICVSFSDYSWQTHNACKTWPTRPSGIAQTVCTAWSQQVHTKNINTLYVQALYSMYEQVQKNELISLLVSLTCSQLVTLLWL